MVPTSSRPPGKERRQEKQRAAEAAPALAAPPSRHFWVPLSFTLALVPIAFVERVRDHPVLVWSGLRLSGYAPGLAGMALPRDEGGEHYPGLFNCLASTALPSGMPPALRVRILGVVLEAGLRARVAPARTAPLRLRLRDSPRVVPAVSRTPWGSGSSRSCSARTSSSGSMTTGSTCSS